MRYSSIVQVDTVSQWRDTYVNYEYLRVFIVTIQKILDGITDYDQINKQRTYGVQSEEIVMIGNADQTVGRLRVLANQVNQIFLKEFNTQREICQMFCIIKLNEISEHFMMCERFSAIADEQQKKQKLIPYIQYTYIQSVYLVNNFQGSEDQERKTIKKHIKCVENRLQHFKALMPDFILEPNKRIKGIISSLQKMYLGERINVQEKASQKLSRKLRREKTKSLKQELRALPKNIQSGKTESFTFGMWVGLFISVIIFMSILMAYRGFSVEKDPIFNRDFPVWRGIAFIILYIWSLGFVVYYYKKYKISHFLVLDFKGQHYINYASIFNIAGVFSTIFGLLFALYALAITGMINLGGFAPRYFALIIWLLFIAFMFNPIPTKYHRSRLYIFKTLAKIFIFPFLPITFNLLWFIIQLFSLVTVFEDFIYSICYFTSLDFDNYDPLNNECRKPASIGVFVYCLVLFILAIMLCIKSAYDNKKFFGTEQFYNIIRVSLGIITTVLSFVWDGSTNGNIFPAWIVFTILGTILSYMWDLRLDGGLLQFKSQYWMIRDKIMYAPGTYYTFIVANLFLSFVWILTLSPKIAEGGFGSFQLFRLVTGGLEILRRGLWNLIAIQYLQIDLCNNLKAMPNCYYRLIKEIQQKIDTAPKPNTSLPSQQQINKYQSYNETQKVGSPTKLKNSFESLGNIDEKVINLSLENVGELTEENLIKRIRVHEQQMKEARKILKQKNQEADRIIKSLRN